MVLISRQCFWHVWTSAISETAFNHVRKLLERRLFRRLHFRHVQRFILNIYLRKSLCYMTRTSKTVFADRQFYLQKKQMHVRRLVVAMMYFTVCFQKT